MKRRSRGYENHLTDNDSLCFPNLIILRSPFAGIRIYPIVVIMASNTDCGRWGDSNPLKNIAKIANRANPLL